MGAMLSLQDKAQRALVKDDQEAVLNPGETKGVDMRD